MTAHEMELSGIKSDVETCMTVLDNVGLLPHDLESYQNSEARLLIYRAVVNDTVERLLAVLDRLRKLVK